MVSAVGVDELAVDADFAELVDDHRDPPGAPLRQDAIEEGGLAGAEKARQHGGGDRLHR